MPLTLLEIEVLVLGQGTAIENIKGDILVINDTLATLTGENEARIAEIEALTATASATNSELDRVKAVRDVLVFQRNVIGSPDMPDEQACEVLEGWMKETEKFLASMPGAKRQDL